MAIDAGRWAELYRLEFPRVYRALLAVLRDRDRALDALHDAFVAGLRRPPAHDADLAGWLFVVAVRSARRGLRLPSLPLERVRGRSGGGGRRRAPPPHGGGAPARGSPRGSTRAGGRSLL